MKKTLIALSLATSFVAGSAMAVGSSNTNLGVPAAVQQYQTNQAQAQAQTEIQAQAKTQLQAQAESQLKKGEFLTLVSTPMKASSEGSAPTVANKQVPQVLYYACFKGKNSSGADTLFWYATTPTTPLTSTLTGSGAVLAHTCTVATLAVVPNQSTPIALPKPTPTLDVAYNVLQ